MYRYLFICIKNTYASFFFFLFREIKSSLHIMRTIIFECNFYLIDLLVLSLTGTMIVISQSKT